MMHAPTLWTSQGGGGGGGGYPVEVVIDFAALDTQDLSAVPLGDTVTLSDGSQWVMIGSPFAATSFGVVNGQGLVFASLPGIVGFEARGLARWAGDVHPTFATGACRVDAQIAATSAMVPDTYHGITAYWPQLPTFPGAPVLTGSPSLYLTHQIVCGGPFPIHVKTALGSNGVEYMQTRIAFADYPGNRGLAVPLSFDLGLDIAPGNTTAGCRGTCWDLGSSPLAWPSDMEHARTGYWDVGRAVSLGLANAEGSVSSWLSGGVDASPVVAGAHQVFMGASTPGQTARVRAMRWRSAA